MFFETVYPFAFFAHCRPGPSTSPRVESAVNFGPTFRPPVFSVGQGWSRLSKPSVLSLRLSQMINLKCYILNIDPTQSHRIPLNPTVETFPPLQTPAKIIISINKESSPSSIQHLTFKPRSIRLKTRDEPSTNPQNRTASPFQLDSGRGRGARAAISGLKFHPSLNGIYTHPAVAKRSIFKDSKKSADTGSADWTFGTEGLICFQPL